MPGTSHLGVRSSSEPREDCLTGLCETRPGLYSVSGHISSGELPFKIAQPLWTIRMKRIVTAAALAAFILGSECLPLRAADLGPIADRYTRTTHHSVDPCSWQGHFCLYAFDGYVYHRPWHVTRYDSYARSYRPVVRARD